jgi:hypothetical protein
MLRWDNLSIPFHRIVEGKRAANVFPAGPAAVSAFADALYGGGDPPDPSSAARADCAEIYKLAMNKHVGQRFDGRNESLIAMLPGRLRVPRFTDDAKARLVV